jgi:hypothetical protein
MAGVRRALEQIGRLRDNLTVIAEESVSQSKDGFIEAQKAQLEQGSNATGESFRKYRNPAYARLKNAMNPLPGLGNPDLKYTGSFYRGIYATVQNGRITVGSSDSKAQALEASYKNVFGLTRRRWKIFYLTSFVLCTVKILSTH